MIFLQKRYFFHRNETIEAGAEPFVIRAISESEIGDIDKKENENEQRQDGCLARDALQFQPVQQVEEGEKKGESERINCPDCPHASYE